MRKCTVEDCDRERTYKLYCTMHHHRVERHGDPLYESSRLPPGAGTITQRGYIRYNLDGRMVYEHILLAEKALGKPLPKGAQVHHVNGNGLDNTLTNLVVCPDDSYHKLLHKRSNELGWPT